MDQTGATSQSNALPALELPSPPPYPHPQIFHLPWPRPLTLGPKRNLGKPRHFIRHPFLPFCLDLWRKDTFLVLIPQGRCAHVANRFT